MKCQTAKKKKGFFLSSEKKNMALTAISKTSEDVMHVSLIFKLQPST